MKTWQREPQLLSALDNAIPDIIDSQKDNGQFGSEPWISTDQNVLLALAAAWSLKDSAHYQRKDVLEAIERGGYAIQDAQDEVGMVIFRKKDHSTWGQIYMPWVYSRMVRAFYIVKEAMSAEAQQRWGEALTLAYDGIARTALDRIHNIPTHHAMGLYCAGAIFERRDWQEQARDFLHQVVDAQSADGWWAEHKGPVVAYNLVYAESLGVYYTMSGDEKVLDALTRAAHYHAACAYPDGSLLETIDGRNPHHDGVRLGNVGFAHTPAGRGFLAQQHALFAQGGGTFDADYAAHMLLYGADGELVETAAAQNEHTSRIGDDALVVRRRPWFYALSAFTAEIPQNRFGQDRQNFASIYHDDIGLIVGGGNTKLQPLWSSFTVGDTALLSHTAGDEEPDFNPRAGLLHVPDSAELLPEPHGVAVQLHYGETACRITLCAADDRELTITLAATMPTPMPVAAHITLIAHIGQALKSAVAHCETLGEETLDWPDPEWIEHAGWRLDIPSNGRLYWPVRPHNPYRKDGAATIEEARLVIALPFDETAEHVLKLRIL